MTEKECEECGSTITLDGRGETKIASLQGPICMECHEPMEPIDLTHPEEADWMKEPANSLEESVERDEPIMTTAVLCDACDVAYESSPANLITPTEFNHCPNCGEEIEAEREEITAKEYIERLENVYD